MSAASVQTACIVYVYVRKWQSSPGGTPPWRWGVGCRAWRHLVLCPMIALAYITSRLCKLDTPFVHLRARNNAHTTDRTHCRVTCLVHHVCHSVCAAAARDGGSPGTPPPNTSAHIKHGRSPVSNADGHQPPTTPHDKSSHPQHRRRSVRRHVRRALGCSPPGPRPVQGRNHQRHERQPPHAQHKGALLRADLQAVEELLAHHPQELLLGEGLGVPIGIHVADEARDDTIWNGLGDAREPRAQLAAAEHA